MDTDLYGHRPRNVNLCRGWEYPISRLNLSAASSVGGWEIFRSRRRLESSSPYAVDSSNPSLCQFELSDFQPSKSHPSEGCSHCREPCPSSLQMLSEKMMAHCNLS